MVHRSLVVGVTLLWQLALVAPLVADDAAAPRQEAPQPKEPAKKPGERSTSSDAPADGAGAGGGKANQYLPWRRAGR